MQRPSFVMFTLTRNNTGHGSLIEEVVSAELIEVEHMHNKAIWRYKGILLGLTVLGIVLTCAPL